MTAVMSGRQPTRRRDDAHLFDGPPTRSRGCARPTRGLRWSLTTSEELLMTAIAETRAAAVVAKYPGIPAAMDGTAAVVAMETAGGEAAGAYPITPSTQMGEGWAEAVAEGRTNVHGRRLL